MAETNARKRPIGFVETSTVESDDYILIDGQTSGTRKIKPDKVGKANTSDLNNDAGFQNASEVAAAIAANIDTELETAGKAADAKAVGDALATKVDAASGKGLSTNDYTTAEKTKLAGIATGATRVLIDSGLSESGKAADAAAVGTALAGKVDKVTGKGLSANDYTTAEKTKLAGIQEGAAAVDSTLSVTGKAADAKKTGDEITLLKQDITEIETVLETKANIDGSYEQMIVGNAEQLTTDKGITDKVPYLLRASGGNGADREVDKIVGGTVAWNQLLRPSEKATSEINGVTYTNNEDGSWTVSGTATADTTYFFITEPFSRSGHVVLYSYGATSSDGNYKIGDFSFGYSVVTGNQDATIVRRNSNATIVITVQVYSGKQVNITVTPQLFDLTQMFSTAIADRAYAMEQATAGSGIAWLKSMGFFTKDYYEYDAGTLKSVEGLTAHSMVGFNQWDEEWELGIWNGSGAKEANTQTIRCKNLIRVLPNTAYCVTYPTNGLIIRTLDESQGYVGTITPYTSTKGAGYVFTTDANVHYIAFCTYASDNITTYNHDICINLSDPDKNGTYEPYEKHSYPLDSTLTLRGIPKQDANNQVYYDGDTYESDGTVTRRYGIVDLGTLNWSMDTPGDAHQRFSSSGIKTLVKPPSAGNIAVNVVCSKYVTETPDRLYLHATDESIGCDTSGVLFIWDSKYASATASDFKASLSGTYLVYELKSAGSEEADPYTNPQILDPYGTEEYVTTGIVPVGHETFYPENLRAKIEGLPFNFATLIAPTEAAYKATRAYSANNLFIVDNILYKATTSILNGGTITPGTNCTATTLAEIIAALS